MSISFAPVPSHHLSWMMSAWFLLSPICAAKTLSQVPGWSKKCHDQALGTPWHETVLIILQDLIWKVSFSTHPELSSSYQGLMPNHFGSPILKDMWHSPWFCDHKSLFLCVWCHHEWGCPWAKTLHGQLFLCLCLLHMPPLFHLFSYDDPDHQD